VVETDFGIQECCSCADGGAIRYRPGSISHVAYDVEVGPDELLSVLFLMLYQSGAGPLRIHSILSHLWVPWFNKTILEERARRLCVERGLSFRDFCMALRVALTGKTTGLDLFWTMEWFGPVWCDARLRQAEEFAKQMETDR